MLVSGKSFTKSLLALAVCSAANSYAVDLGEFGGTKVSLKGYVKFDAIISDYSDGSLAAQNLGRDFYVPSLTPVAANEDAEISESPSIDFHAKQSRFGLSTASDVNGEALSTYIEMDFIASTGGNERITNSYSPRLRHAFIKYGSWTIGQTWSTFFNVGALPETLDFVGSTDATIFARQAQIRYTNGGFQFALENPETTVTVAGDRVVTDDNTLPDLVLRYNFGEDRLKVTAAALVRQLQYEVQTGDPLTEIDETEQAVAFSISGVLKFGEHNAKIVINTGSGMGRYIGLNVANGAVYNPTDGSISAIDSTGVNASVHFVLSEKLRTNLTYSQIDIDNDTDLTGQSATSGTKSFRANLIYSPAPKLSFGGEIAWAERSLENDEDGDMTRLQFSAKLAF